MPELTLSYIVLVTALAFLIVLLLFLHFNLIQKTPHLPFLSQKQSVVPSYRTGDLLFLSGKTYAEGFIKWYMNFPFSHVAMVIVENDIVYLWEADMGQQTKKGARVIELSKKKQLWKGWRIGGYCRYKGPDIHADDIDPIVFKYINYDIDTKLLSYFFGQNSQKKEMFCSQLIAQTFIDLGIFKGDTVATNYSPKRLSTMSTHNKMVYIPFGEEVSATEQDVSEQEVREDVSEQDV